MKTYKIITAIIIMAIFFGFLLRGCVRNEDSQSGGQVLIMSDGISYDWTAQNYEIMYTEGRLSYYCGGCYYEVPYNWDENKELFDPDLIKALEEFLEEKGAEE